MFFLITKNLKYFVNIYNILVNIFPLYMVHTFLCDFKNKIIKNTVN